jgi:hypothetical protein
MKAFNPNPDPQLVKGIYNGFYARQRKDGEGKEKIGASEPLTRKNARGSRAHRLEHASAADIVRARTHDNGMTEGTSHVAWLARMLLAEMKECGPQARISAEIRLELIQCLSRS